MTVGIVTDSAAALPADVARSAGVRVVPLKVVVDGVTLEDTGIEPYGLVGRDDVSTSGPSPGAFASAIGEVGGPDGVVVLTVSAELSSTHQSALLGAADAGDQPVRVVDTRNAAGGQALVVLAAAARAQAGAGLDEVEAEARHVGARVRLVGALATTEQLVHSGRIPAMAGWTADRLGVRPMFEIGESGIRRLRPARSIDRAHERMMAMWRRSRPVGDAPLHVVALHAAAPERAEALLAELGREITPATALVSGFGPAMIANSGLGVFGVAWWWDDPSRV